MTPESKQSSLRRDHRKQAEPVLQLELQAQCKQTPRSAGRAAMGWGSPRQGALDLGHFSCGLRLEAQREQPVVSLHSEREDTSPTLAVLKLED